MNSNKVYYKISFYKYQKIKQSINEKYKIYQKEASTSVADLFQLKTKKGKITFTYHKTNTLMVQSSSNNKDFINIVKEIDDIHPSQTEKQNYTYFSLSEDKLDFDYYVGCDEAGKGETFGSLFLGCALIKKENLKLIEGIINNKNIRKLDKNNITNLEGSLVDKYDFLSKEYSAKEIDDFSLTVLLDKGYKQLLSKIVNNKNNILIAIDDYGIGMELKDYIKTIENDDIKVIVKHKADEEYTACKIASLGARSLRVNEVKELDKKFVLIEGTTGEKIYPSTGSSSNSNTEKYLRIFRKQNPTLEFPSFVRKKWNNVKLIDIEYLKQ